MDAKSNGDLNKQFHPKPDTFEYLFGLHYSLFESHHYTNHDAQSHRDTEFHSISDDHFIRHSIYHCKSDANFHRHFHDHTIDHRHAHGLL